jgi:hypothetical protein
MKLKLLEASGLLAVAVLALPAALVTPVAHAVAYAVLVASMLLIAFAVRPKQPATTIVWMTGTVVLAARVFVGGTTLDPRLLALLSLVFGLAVTLATSAGERTDGISVPLPQRIVQRFFYIASAVGILYGGNQLLDFRDSDHEISSVAGSKVLRAGTPFAQYRLTLKAWDPEDPWRERDFAVSEAAYAALEIGAPVDVEIRRGAFGSAWVGGVTRAIEK